MQPFFNFLHNFTFVKSTFWNIANIIPIMTSSTTATTYSSHYERMSGNCTRLLAAQIIQDVKPPITGSSYILDNACGPGIVSEQIKLLYPDAKILATDLAPGMIDEVQNAIKTNGWSEMKTEMLDVRDLATLKDEIFTHVITNLGMPVPDDINSSPKIVSEMFRVLKRGGVAVMSTWAGKAQSSRCVYRY